MQVQCNFQVNGEEQIILHPKPWQASKAERWGHVSSVPSWQLHGGGGGLAVPGRGQKALVQRAGRLGWQQDLKPRAPGGVAAGEFPRLFMSLLSVVMWVPAPLPRLLLDDLWDL